MILCICLAVFQSAFMYIIQTGRMEFEFMSRKYVRDSQIDCFLTFFGSFAHLRIWQKLWPSYPERYTYQHINKNSHSLKGILGSPPRIKNCSNFTNEETIMTASLWGGRVKLRSRNISRLAQSLTAS